MKKLFNICRKYLEEEYGAGKASHFSDIFHDKPIEYLDQKGKTKKKDDTTSTVLYAKLTYSDKNKN